MGEMQNKDLEEVYSVVKTLIENQRLIIDLIKELKTEQERIKEELKLNNANGFNMMLRREMMN